MERIAARTVDAALEAGFSVGVVTDSPEVVAWSEVRGVETIREPSDEPPGLDRAARAAARHAHGLDLPWAIVHGDLPLVTGHDLRSISDELPPGGVVLAPSYDGGTNVLAGYGSRFPFAYGPGSFRRHLARAAHSPIRVVVRRGLALDLDSARDLSTAGLA